MKFLFDLFKSSTKGDNYRATESPEKYADNIASLNSTGNTKTNTKSLSKSSKSKNALSQNSTGNPVPPGTR